MQPNSNDCGSVLKTEAETDGDSGVEIKHKCKQCHKTFTFAKGLQLHMRCHSAVKPYQCKHCNSSFYYLCDLQAHSLVHSGGRRLSCPHCDTYIRDKNALTLHMRRHTGEKPYTCEFCKKSFARNHDLRRHVRVHTEELLYKCNHCDRVFSQLSAARYHEASHSTEKPFSCQICAKSFVTLAHLERHARLHRHSGEINCLCKDCWGPLLVYDKVNECFQCPYCSATFRQLDGLKVHMSTGGETLHSCLTCVMTFCSEKSLSGHMKTHEKAYVCQYCDRGFVLRTKLLAHIKRHAVSCSIDVGQLIMHTKAEPKRTVLLPAQNGDFHAVVLPDESGEQILVQSGHPDANVELHQYNGKFYQKTFISECRLPEIDQNHSTDESIYLCQQCSCSFLTRDQLLAHAQNHDDGFLYQSDVEMVSHAENHGHTGNIRKLHTCEHCGHPFSKLCSLRKHIARHHLIKEWNRCQFCDQSFDQRIELLLHMVSHSNEKRYFCKCCEKSFVRPSYVQIHESTHTLDELSYFCRSCDQAFVTKDEWLAHRRTHRQKDCHYCEYCGKTFNYSQNLRRHLRSHVVRLTKVLMRQLVEIKPHACKCCDMSFASDKGLNKHEKSKHTVDDLPFLCPSCTRSFLTRDDLLQHVRAHEDTGKNTCRFCGKSYSRPYCLRRHERDHTNQAKVKRIYRRNPCPSRQSKPGQYFCCACDKSYRHRASLYKHEANHLKSDKLYFCQYCTKRCQTSEVLLAHVKNHLRVKRLYYCKFCKMSFKHRYVFHQHESSHLTNNNSTAFLTNNVNS